MRYLGGTARCALVGVCALALNAYGQDPSSPPLLTTAVGRPGGEEQARQAAEKQTIAESIIAQAEAASGRALDPGFRARVKADLTSRSFEQLATVQKRGSGVLPIPESLGDSQADLVYTPVIPCRIIDTRVAGGAIPANTTRDFHVSGVLSGQGGNPGGCGIPFGPATAAVINFVAVSPAGPGDLRITPLGTPMPVASIINYSNRDPALNIANGPVVTMCNPAITTCSNDITIQADASSVQLVADVQGYFRNVAGISIGGNNTAVGLGALNSNSIGGGNAAFGNFALSFNTMGINNSAFGETTLSANSTGSGNSAFGFGALGNLSMGSFNIAMGVGAGDLLFFGSNNIHLGNAGTSSESNTIRIGTLGTQTAAFVAGISGATSASGVPVLVNPSGQLGTTTSSRRFKDEIADMAEESDVLMKLRPVAFYYKPEYDDTRTRQYGLVAEEVAEVAPELVLSDRDGAPQTVRYHFVNAMLLNEVQKQRARIHDLEARLGRLEAALAGGR
jgi:hypothetical protein